MKRNTEEPERHICFAPSSFRPPDPDELDKELRPTLADIKAFTPTRANPEDRDADRLTLMLPQFIHVALEMLATTARTPLNTVALWASGRGLQRLDDFEGVQAVCSAREAVLRAGSDVAQFEWSFRIGHGARERLALRHVERNLHGKFAKLRRGLGLPPATVGALALMCGLVDSPVPGDDLPRTMLLELVEFQRRLRQHALIVGELQKRAVAIQMDGTRLEITWSDVVKGR